MNKKIKIIDLFERIVNKEKIPKKILYDNEEYVFNGESFVCCDHDATPLFSECEYEYNINRLINFLNDEVEILEDNTEEIEELLIELLEKVKNTPDDVIDKAIDSLHRKLRKENK